MESLSLIFQNLFFSLVFMIYRFIAAPADKTKQQTLDATKRVLSASPNDIAEVYVFDIPELKVGPSPHSIASLPLDSFLMISHSSSS